MGIQAQMKMYEASSNIYYLPYKGELIFASLIRSLSFRDKTKRLTYHKITLQRGQNTLLNY